MTGEVTLSGLTPDEKSELERREAEVVGPIEAGFAEAKRRLEDIVKGIPAGNIKVLDPDFLDYLRQTVGDIAYKEARIYEGGVRGARSKILDVLRQRRLTSAQRRLLLQLRDAHPDDLSEMIKEGGTKPKIREILVREFPEGPEGTETHELHLQMGFLERDGEHAKDYRELGDKVRDVCDLAIKAAIDNHVPAYTQVSARDEFYKAVRLDATIMVNSGFAKVLADYEGKAPQEAGLAIRVGVDVHGVVLSHRLDRLLEMMYIDRRELILALALKRIVLQIVPNDGSEHYQALINHFEQHSIEYVNTGRIDMGAVNKRLYNKYTGLFDTVNGLVALFDQIKYELTRSEAEGRGSAADIVDLEDRLREAQERARLAEDRLNEPIDLDSIPEYVALEADNEALVEQNAALGVEANESRADADVQSERADVAEADLDDTERELDDAYADLDSAEDALDEAEAYLEDEHRERIRAERDASYSADEARAYAGRAAELARDVAAKQMALARAEAERDSQSSRAGSLECRLIVVEGERDSARSDVSREAARAVGAERLRDQYLGERDSARSDVSREAARAVGAECLRDQYLGERDSARADASREAARASGAESLRDQYLGERDIARADAQLAEEVADLIAVERDGIRTERDQAYVERDDMRRERDYHIEERVNAEQREAERLAREAATRLTPAQLSEKERFLKMGSGAALAGNKEVAREYLEKAYLVGAPLGTGSKLISFFGGLPEVPSSTFTAPGERYLQMSITSLLSEVYSWVGKSKESQRLAAESRSY